MLYEVVGDGGNFATTVGLNSSASGFSLNSSASGFSLNDFRFLWRVDLHTRGKYETYSVTPPVAPPLVIAEHRKNAAFVLPIRICHTGMHMHSCVVAHTREYRHYSKLHLLCVDEPSI